ncbi:MAG: hypothetical protein IKK96_04795 [Lachnospiraceae bacterium]|nr:hypothetical protein [Lachnospiraceae bacterium]
MLKKICIGVIGFVCLFSCGGCAMQESDNVINCITQTDEVWTTTSESVTEMPTEMTIKDEADIETITTDFETEEFTETNTEEPSPTETTVQETETTTLCGEYVYATSVANIRLAPNTKGNIVGQTEIGREYLCFEKLENGWCHLKINGADVYCYGKYLSEKPTDKKPYDDPYTYEDMVEDIDRLSAKYEKGFKAEVLGTSYDDRNIYLLTIGNPDAEKSVFFTASIHGAEYISSQLAMAQAEYYLDNPGEQYDGVSFEQILDKVCIYILPMVNPDSVAINQSGFFAIRNPELRDKLFELEYNDRWSSNARGVDVNRNFPTSGFGKENASKQDYSGPSFKYYEGEYAASEKETQYIIDFVKSKDNICAYISYHTKGEVIYWNKGQKGDLYKNTSYIVKLITKLTGYRNIKDYQLKSGIDYEWAVLEAEIPGCTVEIGDMDSYFPVRQSQWKDIWTRNREVMIAVTKYAFN